MSTTSQSLGWIEYHRFNLFGLCSKPDIFACIEKNETTNREYWTHVMKRDNIYSSWCVSRTISIGKRMFLREIPETSRLLRWLGGPTIFFSHVLFTTCDCMNSAIARCMKINIWNNTPTFESIQSSLMHCLKGLDVLLEIRAVYLQTYMYIYICIQYTCIYIYR